MKARIDHYDSSGKLIASGLTYGVDTALFNEFAERVRLHVGDLHVVHGHYLEPRSRSVVILTEWNPDTRSGKYSAVPLGGRIEIQAA